MTPTHDFVPGRLPDHVPHRLPEHEPDRFRKLLPIRYMAHGPVEDIGEFRPVPTTIIGFSPLRPLPSGRGQMGLFSYPIARENSKLIPPALG